jgi:sterol desaturase/sphingolipid hydroxylase (fatty acid hydroxylase superfamily)
MDLTYDWLAGLSTVILIIGIVAIGQFLIFRIPSIAQAREINNAMNKEKWRNKAKKYHHRVKSSQRIGLTVNLAFFVGIMPFLVTLEPQPWYRIALDVFLIMMIYDFCYYLTHRFVFHGKGYFHKVHAVHHQARSRVSSIDSHLLHPAEICIGIALFYVVTTLFCIAAGEPFHIATIVIATVIYTQINQINHCKIDLHSFPWRTLNWIAIRHDAHHIDMQKGNYATITLFYDMLFGTLEKNPLELEFEVK